MWPFNKKKREKDYKPRSIDELNINLHADQSLYDPMYEEIEKKIIIIEDAKEAKQVVEGPPCPVEIMLHGLCICYRCSHLKKCAMELECRKDDCRATIGGCTFYESEEDKNAENKRRVFKDRTLFEPNVFRFHDKQSENTTESK